MPEYSQFFVQPCQSLLHPPSMNISLSTWLFLFITLSINLDLVPSQCLDHELLTLLKLKQGLTFDAYLSSSKLKSKLTSWNSSTDCCSWAGVTCNDSHVTGLDLSSESISGGIGNTSNLFDLQYLQSLNLANNSFHAAQIPSGLGKLVRFLGLNGMQVNIKFRKLLTSSLSDISPTRTKIRVLKRSLPRLIMVRDVSDPAARKLGVDALPAVVGWLSNGEKHTLKTRISVKDVKSAVEDLSALLDGFEKRNKKTASSQAKKPHSEAGDKQIPLLTPFNFDALCGDTAPVCIIGAFRSSKARGKLETILSSVSQKSLLRRRSLASSSGDAIGFALLDASKHPSFLNSLDKSGFKSLDKLVVAYKPRKGKFTAFVGEFSTEEVEWFIGSVLNGDVKFSKTRQKPTLK